MEKYKVNSNTVDSVKKIGNAIGRIPHPSAKIASTAINKSSKIVGNGLNRVNNAIKNHNMSEQEVMASNKDKFINNSSPLSKVFGFGNKKSSSLFFGDGNFSKRLWNRIPTGLKIKLIVGGGACLLLLLMVYTVFAQDDVHNLSLTNGTSISGSSTGSRKCSAEEIENKLLYVGDSRTVGMQTALENQNIVYIAEVGKGYEWFNSTALPNIETKLQEKTDAVIVLGLGVNDLYNIDNYISAYKSLIAKYPTNSFYVLSVNPVDETKTGANGYTVTNADIENFNKKLASNFPNNYIDSYSSLTSIGTSDGLHYDNETYKVLNGIVTSNISSSGKIMCGSSGNLAPSLEEVANWYIQNVAKYDQSLYVQSPFTTSKVRADCTGFAVAFMSYVAGVDIPISWSGEMVYPDGSWAQNVSTYGWKVYTSDEIGELQFGDILVAHSGALYSTKGQHAEIYVDATHTFGWGSVQKAYPKSNTITKTTSGGHVHFMDSGHDYITIYRYEGAVSSDSSGSSNAASLNAMKMNDSSFNHGTKPKSNQKYIMLHDTEMSQDAKTVVQSWKNSGSGVAAHFVVDRDGTIIQAVDLDTITHHAGWGGPGNYDAKFSVGNNDGKGNGDDLVGTSKAGYASYTSYGMNSYSIGIEMCHVNGETYPSAQLEAVDKVIAYIDSYYGFKSTIIVHKDWRPSNSDTDVKFATYLNNYKTLRHH